MFLKEHKAVIKRKVNMKSAPVSFGSILVFTINDNKPKAEVPDLIRTAFKNNPYLQQYNLTDTFEYTDERIDGTAHNASSNFCFKLKEKYKKILPKGSKDVILTKADFYFNPEKTQEKYFLTAATSEDEKEIHKILSKSSVFYAARF